MNKLFNLSDFVTSFIYKTEDGDDLSSIAEKFHTTESLLITLNALKEQPRPGDVLLVERVEGEPYVVKPGDTLLSIAGGDKDKVYMIMNNNRVDTIFVGQKIYI